jgi:hypothetical protein
VTVRWQDYAQRPPELPVDFRADAELRELRRLLRLQNFPGAGGGGGVTDGDKGDVVVSGGGTVWLLDTAALAERIDDRVAALLVAGSNITLTYNDVANTLTIAATGGGGTSYMPGGW